MMSKHEKYMRVDECGICGATSFFHKLDCSKPIKVISELDPPQEMKIEMVNGYPMKIQRILYLDCHRCGRLRTFNGITTKDESMKLKLAGMNKNGEIRYFCYYCHQPGVMELTSKRMKLIEEALRLENE